VDFQSLANLGEIIGGIAVVVSLIYLSVQIRQNTKSQQTENYARSLDRLSAQQAQFARDGEIAMMFSTGVRDTSLLTPKERVQFTWILYEIFDSFEFMFHAAQSNDMPAEVWAKWSSTIAYWLMQPGVLAWWHARPTPYTKSFSDYVDVLIKDSPAGEEVDLRWREFVSAKQG
jgi:hypothetical protein